MCRNHNTLKSFADHNIGGGAFHNKTNVSQWGGCPSTVASGPLETDKSTAIKLDLAMVGMEESAKYSE